MADHRALAVLAALLVASTLGCGPRPVRPWERIDLWERPPTVETTPFVNPAKLPFQATIGYLGAKEVRDLARVPPSTFAAYPHQSAGQVRTLEQVAGSTLGFRVKLGAEPYLSFTPLLDPQAPCACAFRVSVRAGTGGGAGASEVRRTSPTLLPGKPPLAPPVEQVDLGRWAGQEIEILLQVDGPEPAAGAERSWVAWASPAVYSRGEATQRRAPAGPPNLLLIGIDTLRADHVGAFRKTAAGTSLTPAIDRLAAASDVWLDAYSAFNVTNPSFASILTGLYGKNHGVYDLKTPLPESFTTLVELAAARGYDTRAVISAHHLGAHNSGLGQGFADTLLADEHYAAELPVEQSMDWIAQRRKPFFLWLHLFDPHTPHTPPRPFAEGMAPDAPAGLTPIRGWHPFVSPVREGQGREGQGLEAYEQPVLAGNVRLYAGEVAYLDYQVGRLLDDLESRGLLENTIVALVADHGENLGEHGILCRHIGLWETTTHVPLLIRWPEALRRDGRGAGQRFAGLVQTIDLFPTLLAALGIALPPQDGSDLYALTGAGKPGRRAVFSEDASHMGVSVRTRDHRLVRAAGNPVVPDGIHLYDLGADLAEDHDLAGTGLAIEAQLDRVLTAWLADRRATADAPSRELSPEEIARLKALGYL